MNKNIISGWLPAPMLAAALIVSTIFATDARPARAAEGFEDKTEGFHQCVIVAARGTRSVVAVQMMENACQKLWYESAMMRDSDKQAYVCLLRALPGVDNDYAAQIVYASCANQR